MTTSFTTLKTRAGANAVAWAEISGIGIALSSGYVTEANKAALLTDAYTPTLTFYSALESLVDSESRSIDLLSGKGTRGGFSLKLTDFRTSTYPDGYFTWLFGSQRSTIAHAMLAEDIDINETAWVLDSANNTMPLSGDGVDPRLAYCGLETVWYLNHFTTGSSDPYTWDTVTRSAYLSPSIWHKQNSAGVYKRVTDHPTVWRGRIVRLFVTFEAAGELAGGAAAARASAHQIVGILERVQFDGEHWVLECSSLDKLLDREACKGLATARVARRIDARAGRFASVDGLTHDGTTAPALHIVQYESATGNEHQFDVYVAAGAYSPVDFVNAVNAAIPGALDYAGGAFVGGLSIAYADGATLTAQYRSAAAGGERWTMVDWAFPTNYENHGNLGTALIWERIVARPYDTVDVTAEEFQNITANTNYSATVDAVQDVTISGEGTKTIALQSGPEDSSPTLFSIAGDDNLVVVESQAGRQLAGVIAADGANGTIQVIFKGDEILHDGTPENPIRVTQCVYLSSFDDMVNGPIGTSALRMLLSTGLAGFNEATYDTLPAGVGIEWPNETPTAGADTSVSLIDIGSFERAFADASVYCDRVVDIFYKPFKFRQWLEARLAFFGFYVTVENGQIKARRGLTVLQHQQDLAISKSEMIDAALSFGEDAGIKGVRFMTGRPDFGGIEYTRTYLLGAKSDLELDVLELKDAGVVTDESRLLLLSQNILVEYAKESWRYVVDVDRALLDVEPGMVLAVSDTGAGDTSSFAGRGLPNPDGTRGLTGVRMLCLSADTDWEDGIRTRLELLCNKTKRGGYSASALVSTFTNVGAAALTCVDNIFSPVADGADASRFSVGDKVRLVLVNAVLAGRATLPDADGGGESGLTIASISGNVITLTTTIDPQWVGTDTMVLIHDQYQTASQTATAQAWSHIGDASGDIGDLAGSVAYEW